MCSQKLCNKVLTTNQFIPIFWDQWCYRFSEGYPNDISTVLSSCIFNCCPRNLEIQEERIGNVVSTLNWITPVGTGTKLLCCWFCPVVIIILRIASLSDLKAYNAMSWQGGAVTSLYTLISPFTYAVYHLVCALWIHTDADITMYF